MLFFASTISSVVYLRCLKVVLVEQGKTGKLYQVIF